MEIYNPVGGGGNPGTFTFVTATGDITPSVTFGAFSYGALSYSDTNNVFVGQTSVNSYLQMVLQNTNAGSAAATSYVASNNQATSTTNYAEFGINSSGFTGSGSFSAAGYSYVASASTDLAIGTYGANGIHFVVNNGATDAMAISSAGVVSIAGAPVSALGSTDALFGTGADGTVTISSGTTTLTRDMHYANLTMSGTGVLKLNGYRVYVNGTLDLSGAPAGAIISNGPNGNNATGAAGGTAVPSGLTGYPTPSPAYTLSAGGTGNTTTGTNPTQSNGTVPFGDSGGGGAGGAGGAGVSAGAAGLAGQYINSAAITPTPFIQYAALGGFNATQAQPIYSGLYGAAAGQGGGDAVNAGGGGGSGGVPGFYCVIYARTIARGSNSTASIVQAKGGNGGNGANGVAGTAGGGGGGGGGSGGFIFILCETLTGSTLTNALDFSGGTGGTGGNSPSTNKGGTGGTGGGAGAAIVTVLSTPSMSAPQVFSPGNAAAIATTTAGTSGGAGATARANL